MSLDDKTTAQCVVCETVIWLGLMEHCLVNGEVMHRDCCKEHGEGECDTHRPAPEPPICNCCDDDILPGQPVELLHDEPVHRQCYENHVERMAELDYETRMNPDNAPSDAAYRAALKDAGRAHWV